MFIMFSNLAISWHLVGDSGEYLANWKTGRKVECVSDRTGTRGIGVDNKRGQCEIGSLRAESGNIRKYPEIHAHGKGKIKAIEFCRKQKIPYLGLCFGMQLAVVEFARNVCGMKDAHTTEIVKHCKYPVIDVMPEQKALLKKKDTGRR